MTERYHPAVTQQQAAQLRWITHDYWLDDTHLLHGPNVVRDLVIPESTTQPIIKPYSAILHSNAGPRKTAWYDLRKYWGRSDITGEAHFQVATTALVQMMPLNRRADCNYKANSFRLPSGTLVGAISFETEDNGYTTLATTPWTIGDGAKWGQLDSMVSALTWICVCYGVYCTVPTRWNDTGIGHHSLFPEWSSYVGKTCPGAARIRQMDYVRQAVAENLAAFIKASGWKCGKGLAT